MRYGRTLDVDPAEELSTIRSGAEVTAVELPENERVVRRGAQPPVGLVSVIVTSKAFLCYW